MVVSRRRIVCSGKGGCFLVRVSFHATMLPVVFSDDCDALNIEMILMKPMVSRVDERIVQKEGMSKE